MDWRDFVNGELTAESASLYGVYPKSVIWRDGSLFFLARESGGLRLVVRGEAVKKFAGSPEGKYLSCGTSVENAYALMECIEEYRPVCHKGRRATLGLGDRLGFATPGQLRAVAQSDVFPILAQQSMREMKLTGRDCEQVIADACFGVMREGWRAGYGADGDHMKHHREVCHALDAGYTMITLDLSDYLDVGAMTLDGTELDSVFDQYFEGSSERLISDYCAQNNYLDLPPLNERELKRYALVYRDGLRFVEQIWNNEIALRGRPVDLEISIDETGVETSPEEHRYVACELARKGVAVVSIAPRFPGEFQKAVDYRGDPIILEAALREHAAIADKMGHKLSVHSGSDKWTACPLIVKATGGRYHVKTSGTNWLEAVRLIAFRNPLLYRRMHAHAIDVYEQARQNYHVSGEVNRIPSLSRLADDKLPDLFGLDDSRQLMHITYGQLLNDSDLNGTPLFRADILDTLACNEEYYAQMLQEHITRHLRLLGEIPYKGVITA